MNAIQFNVSVPVVPAAVSILPSNRPPATFEIGTAFGQVFSPKATVLSSDGLPLAARTVHAVAVGDMRDVGVSAPPLFVTGRPGIPHDVYAPHYETSGSWQALTSENGVATFDKGMKITAASSNSITIALYCDGVFAMWSEVLSSSSLRYTSILGSVPRFPSAALPTDTSRDHVIVVDSYIMRALPSRSIGHLATDAPPDDRVVPLLEVVVNTNGAGGSGVVAFFPGELVFQQVLSNVQVQVRCSLMFTYTSMLPPTWLSRNYYRAGAAVRQLRFLGCWSEAVLPCSAETAAWCRANCTGARSSL